MRVFGHRLIIFHLAMWLCNPWGNNNLISDREELDVRVRGLGIVNPEDVRNPLNRGVAIRSLTRGHVRRQDMDIIAAL